MDIRHLLQDCDNLYIDSVAGLGEFVLSALRKPISGQSWACLNLHSLDIRGCGDTFAGALIQVVEARHNASTQSASMLVAIKTSLCATARICMIQIGIGIKNV